MGSNTTRRANGEGSCYEDKDKGRWVCQVWVDGQRVRGYGKSRTLAIADKTRKVAELGGGPKVDGNRTVGELVDEWRRRELPSKKIGDSARYRYEWHCDLIDADLGQRRLAKLSTRDVEAFLDRLADGTHRGRGLRGSLHRPHGKATLGKIRSTIRQILDWGVGREDVTRNVARVATLAPEAAESTPRTALDREQCQALWEALGDDGFWLGSMYRVQLSTLCRPGEVMGMLWDDVDLESGVWRLCHGVRLIDRRPVIAEELKNSQSIRTIKLPAPALAELRRHQHRQKEQRMAARSWRDARLVFPSRAGTPLNPSNAREQFCAFQIERGLTVVRPHELRHTGISILVDAGVPDHEIADLAGWKSTRMLANYRHPLQPVREAAVVTMGALFG